MCASVTCYCHCQLLVIHVKVNLSKTAHRLVARLFAEVFPDQVPPEHRGAHQDPVEGHAEHRHPVVEGGATMRTGQPLATEMILRLGQVRSSIALCEK